MDQATQQNAAMAEEANSGTETLAATVISLVGKVQQFRLTREILKEQDRSAA